MNKLIIGASIAVIIGLTGCKDNDGNVLVVPMETVTLVCNNKVIKSETCNAGISFIDTSECSPSANICGQKISLARNAHCTLELEDKEY